MNSDPEVIKTPSLTRAGSILPDVPLQPGGLSRGVYSANDVYTRASFNEPEPSLLMEYARVFWRYRITIASFVAAGTILGFLSTVATLPLYRAHTSLEIQNLNNSFMNLRAVDPTGETGNSSEESFVQTQIKLLQSESLITEVVAKLSTPGRAGIERQDLLSQWQREFKAAKTSELSRRDAVKQIAENLKVKPMGLTRLVEVTCEAWDRHMAAEFCNSLTQQFIEDGLQTRFASAQRTSDWLTRQVADVREKLAEAESRLQAFQRENALFYGGDKETMDQDKLRTLQAQLARSGEERIAKQSQFEMSKTAPAETLPMVLDSGPLKEYQIKKTDLERELVQISPPLLPTHPKVQHLRAEIAQLDATIQRERANVINRVRNEYKASLDREKLLADQFTAQQKIVAQQLGKDAQLSILRGDVESNRQLYASLVQRAKEAGFATAMRASTVRVVDPAKEPVDPVAPRRTVSTVAGGLICGLFGIMFALVKHRTDHRLRTPEHVKRELNVRDVGIVPSARLDVGLPRNAFWGRFRPVARQPLDLTTFENRDSLLAESFRVVMNSLFVAKRRSAKKSVVISSPCCGEGKSTVASNLAIALCETRRRVVLIDGDLRNPRLHKSFKVKNDFGLRDVLRKDEAPDAEAIQKLARPTAVPGVFLVSSGTPGPEDAINLLHSPHLPKILSTLANGFDVVLIDTPPVLNLADARIFCELADAAILVVRAGVTTCDMAIAAYDAFASATAPIAGVILNDFDVVREPGYAHYKKSYERYRLTSA